MGLHTYRACARSRLSRLVALVALQVRLKDLFNDFDNGRKGYLNVQELRRLIKALMPDVTEADARYLQVLLGLRAPKGMLDSVRTCVL